MRMTEPLGTRCREVPETAENAAENKAERLNEERA